jgi:hypothetical protein
MGTTYPTSPAPPYRDTGSGHRSGELFDDVLVASILLNLLVRVLDSVAWPSCARLLSCAPQRA